MTVIPADVRRLLVAALGHLDSTPGGRATHRAITDRLTADDLEQAQADGEMGCLPAPLPRRAKGDGR